MREREFPWRYVVNWIIIDKTTNGILRFRSMEFKSILIIFVIMTTVFCLSSYELYCFDCYFNQFYYYCLLSCNITDHRHNVDNDAAADHNDQFDFFFSKQRNFEGKHTHTVFSLFFPFQKCYHVLDIFT